MKNKYLILIILIIILALSFFLFFPSTNSDEVKNVDALPNREESDNCFYDLLKNGNYDPESKETIDCLNTLNKGVCPCWDGVANTCLSIEACRL